MKRLLLGGFVIAISTAACSSAPVTGEEGARQALEEAAAAMGGWEALRAVTAQHIAGQGGDWEPMQALAPGDTRRVSSFSRTVTADYVNRSLRIALNAQRMYPSPRAVSFTEVIEGDAGTLEQADPSGEVSASRLHPARYATRIRDLNRMPVRVLIVASQAEGLTRLPDQIIERIPYQVLRYQDAGQRVNLLINGSTHLPDRVMYEEDDPIFGDTQNEWVWSDWRDVGGIQLPYGVLCQLNGQKLREETITEIQNNPEISPTTFYVSDDIRQQPEDGERIISQWPLRRAVIGLGHESFGRAQNVEMEEITRGVYHARGGSHHSMVVEMSDHVMVFEAPLFEERSLAVIEAIKETIPDKPIRYAMVTHFHIDHLGGIRTYAAEGATVITHSNVIPFVERMLRTPKSVRPDALVRVEARTGQPANVSLAGIATMKEYSDGDRVVEVYAFDNAHAAGMLVAYLPRERIIFTSDLYSPGGPVSPDNANARAFYFNVKAADIPVNRVVGGHGGVGPFRDLARVMEAAGGN